MTRRYIPNNYNKHVFFLPAWKEIYQNDDERKMTFEQARRFGEDVRRSYKDLGYSIIYVPMTDPKTRAEFIIQELKGFIVEELP